jgi:uncharacterized membrane protein
MADDQPGPVEIAVISFPGNQFSGEVAPAIADLVASGTVSLLDLVFITRDDDGNVGVIELDSLDDEITTAYMDIEGDVQGLLADDDFETIGELLEPGSSALAVVWENTWARRFATAVANSGGVLVAHDRIDSATVSAALAEFDELGAGG